MSRWHAARPRRVLAALIRIGWVVKRQRAHIERLRDRDGRILSLHSMIGKRLGHACLPVSRSEPVYHRTICRITPNQRFRSAAGMRRIWGIWDVICPCQPAVSRYMTRSRSSQRPPSLPLVHRPPPSRAKRELALTLTARSPRYNEKTKSSIRAIRVTRLPRPLYP